MKAPTNDVVTAEVLKACRDPMVAMLHKIFNMVYDTEKSPKDWSRMMITPIQKKIDKQTPANYRFIDFKAALDTIWTKVL